MQAPRTSKTLADYLVIAVCPVLIMVLVGSLVFFLVDVFYRGDMRGGLRWVLFWFVLAIVLVARIGIEQGRAYGNMYGLALAGATWVYLAMSYPAYLLGIVLLGIVWWSANQLTWDCTLIDDDDDASGQGLMEVAARQLPEDPPKAPVPTHKTTARIRPSQQSRAKPPDQAKPHAPGLWVVYFSLAALPLYGVGQVLLPADETSLRRRGFAYLFAYLASALGLLLATSFLGLRRYLRQRQLPMPAFIALGWIKSGLGVAVVVLALALVLPRPGADYTWKTLAVQVDHYVRTASQYATPPNPPGKGEGAPSQNKSAQGSRSTSASPDQGKDMKQGGESGPDAQNSTPQGNLVSRTPLSPLPPAGDTYIMIRRLLITVAVLWLAWWLFRERHLILQILGALWEALCKFLRDLLELGPKTASSRKSGMARIPTPKVRLFAAYKNPFLSGKERAWPPEQVIAYSFEAVQAWAREQGWEPRQDLTPRELCLGLEERFPEHAPGWRDLAHLYGYAAYGRQFLVEPNWETLRQLWRGLAEANTRIS